MLSVRGGSRRATRAVVPCTHIMKDQRVFTVS